MKKVFNIFYRFFLFLFIPLAAILLGICLVFILPIDNIKYKRSLYYKKEHKKYELFAATGIKFKLYNEILKNELPINYYQNPNDDSLEKGWFVLGNTLIIPSVFTFEFDLESGKWNYCDVHDEEKRIIMPLDEYIEIEIQEANERLGQVVCNNAIVLINANSVDNIDVAKNEKRFLIYEKNREEILIEFCENRNDF